MKKLFFSRLAVFSMFFIGLLFAGCSISSPNENEKEPSQKLEVSATIFPVYDMVKTVAGDLAEVVLITPPGASPHYFEPNPSLIKNLQGSRAIFSIGEGIDDWSVDLTDSLHSARVISLSQTVSLRTGEVHAHDEYEDVHEDQEEETEGIDPHYWLNPKNAQKMVEQIAKELSELDPQHRSEYEQQAAAFVQELEEKQKEWKSKMNTVENKTVITFHHAFGYFAEYFGLDIVATFEPFPGKEPTAQYMAQIKKEIDEYAISSLYLEPQLPKNVIEQFAQDHNLSIGVLDPIGGVEGRNSYIELIEYNVQTIVQTQ